jgi:hypothetical protein
MVHIPTGVIRWRLKRASYSSSLRDRTCFRCKAIPPAFEYEQYDEEQQITLSYLCEACAQKTLAEWMQRTAGPDYVPTDSKTDFDVATAIREEHQKEHQSGETLLLAHWSAEQRRRKRQGDYD